MERWFIEVFQWCAPQTFEHLCICVARQHFNRKWPNEHLHRSDRGNRGSEQTGYHDGEKQWTCERPLGRTRAELRKEPLDER